MGFSSISSVLSSIRLFKSFFSSDFNELLSAGMNDLTERMRDSLTIYSMIFTPFGPLSSRSTIYENNLKNRHLTVAARHHFLPCLHRKTFAVWLLQRKPSWDKNWGLFLSIFCSWNLSRSEIGLNRSCFA